MAKKSRRARRKERARKKDKRISANDLLEMGRRELDAGRAREALDHLKGAQHKDENLEGLGLLFWEAYVLRARQLEAKGMAKEAQAVQG